MLVAELRLANSYRHRRLCSTDIFGVKKYKCGRTMRILERCAVCCGTLFGQCAVTACSHVMHLNCAVYCLTELGRCAQCGSIEGFHVEKGSDGCEGKMEVTRWTQVYVVKPPNRHSHYFNSSSAQCGDEIKKGGEALTARPKDVLAPSLPDSSVSTSETDKMRDQPRDSQLDSPSMTLSSHVVFEDSFRSVFQSTAVMNDVA